MRHSSEPSRSPEIKFYAQQTPGELLIVMPSMDIFIHESNANPYAAPRGGASVRTGRGLQPIVSLLLLCAAVFAIGWRDTIHTFMMVRIPNGPMSLALYFAPAVHWELFCRMTPRPLAKTRSILSTVCRILFVYFLLTIALHIGLCLAYMNTSTAAQAIRPRIFFAVSVFLAGLCFVQYDTLMARKHSLQEHLGSATAGA